MKGSFVALTALVFGLGAAPAHAQIEGPLRETFTQSFKASLRRLENWLGNVRMLLEG